MLSSAARTFGAPPAAAEDRFCRQFTCASKTRGRNYFGLRAVEATERLNRRTFSISRVQSRTCSSYAEARKRLRSELLIASKVPKASDLAQLQGRPRNRFTAAAFRLPFGRAKGNVYLNKFLRFAEPRGPQPPPSGGPLLFAIAHTRAPQAAARISMPFRKTGVTPARSPPRWGGGEQQAATREHNAFI